MSKCKREDILVYTLLILVEYSHERTCLQLEKEVNIIFNFKLYLQECLLMVSVKLTKFLTLKLKMQKSFKTANFPFPTMDYSPWSSKNLD